MKVLIEKPYLKQPAYPYLAISIDEHPTCVGKDSILLCLDEHKSVVLKQTNSNYVAVGVVIAVHTSHFRPLDNGEQIILSNN